MVGPNIVIDIVSRVKRSSKLWNTGVITEFPGVAYAGRVLGVKHDVSSRPGQRSTH